jgi:LemA protein
MTPLMIGIIVLAAVALVATLSFVGCYNALVALANRFRNAYAQIDVQLKRRYDLIPNLVETARGYLKHESDTLKAVIAARNAAWSANEGVAANPGEPATMKQLVSAEGALSGVLGRLFALSEAYPDLKANTTMLSLMEELTSTENKVSFARQSYNDSVMAYNTKREVFPSSVIASTFHFAAAELFVIDKPEQRDAPAVSFA